MITVLFFTRDEAALLARSLQPLVHDAVEGHITKVVVIDAGSTDSTSKVADSAGCDFERADGRPLREIFADSRSDWFLVLEPGARLAEDWYGPVMDHVMGPAPSAACFRPERRGSWLKRIFFPPTAKRGPLARGLLISKAQALANLSASARTGEDLVRGLALRQLDAEIEMRPKL